MDALERKVRDNLQSMFGGDIAWLKRQPRWRPAWDGDVIIDGRSVPIHVRAEKGKNYVSPMSLRQEAGVHDILERHGVPLPHVYGMMEDPLAIVMDRIPGQINLSTARDDAARDAIRAQYAESLATMHAVPCTEFTALGLDIPAGPEAIALNLYAPCENIYRQRMAGRPFALMEFIWRWLQRNIPTHRARATFISADSGQFLFEDDRLTGLIDFEVGYLGDPLAEFAGLRLRDSTEPLGDIGAMMDHYQALTGDKLDKRSVEFHTAGFCSVSGFLLWPLAFDPDIDDDYVAYLSFSVGTSRWSINAIAESIGLELGDIEVPTASPLGYPAAARHLALTIPGLLGEGELAAYDQSKALSLALYLERYNNYGQSILVQNLDEVSRLLDKRQDNSEAAEAALVEFVRRAGPEHDAALTEYFHRWLMRQDFLLRECGQSAYLTGLRLQAIAQRN